MAPNSLKLPLKRLRFWYNNRLLTTYGCREAIFEFYQERTLLCVSIVNCGAGVLPASATAGKTNELNANRSPVKAFVLTECGCRRGYERPDVVLMLSIIVCV